MSSYWEPALTAAQAKAIADIANGTTSVSVVRPSLAIGAQLSPGAVAWVYSAWVAVALVNDLAAHMLIGFAFQPVGGGATAEVEVSWGTGGAGAEVTIGTFHASFINNSAGLWIPCVPAIQIPANARVAARAADNSGGATAYRVTGTFMPRPLA